MTEDLSRLVSEEARKKGVSQSDAKRAFRKLKNGGMAQVAPQLQAQFMSMNPLMSPREKLKMKLDQARQNRGSKYAKTIAYEKAQQEMAEKQEREKEEKEKLAKEALQKQRNHRRTLRELEKKLGKISDQTYQESLKRVADGQYRDMGLRNRDSNIIELYSKQQEFADKISMDSLDI